jgi:hypothetical protein
VVGAPFSWMGARQGGSAWVLKKQEPVEAVRDAWVGARVGGGARSWRVAEGGLLLPDPDEVGGG